MVSFVNNINSKLLPLPLFVLLLLTSPFQSMPSLTVGQPAISFLGSSAITSRSRRNARGVLQGSLNNWKTTQPGSSTPLCWTSTTTSGSPSCREHRTLVSGEFHWQHRHWTALAYPTVGHRRSPEVGWEMFLFMLPLTTYLSIPASQTLTCPVNHDWKSPRIFLLFLPPSMKYFAQDEPPNWTIGLTPGELVPCGKIYPLHPWTEGHVGVYTGGTSTGLHPFFYLPCCFEFFSSWPRRTEAWGPALIIGH